MKHYLLFYEIVDDYVARRAPLRAAHLEHAQRASERGVQKLRRTRVLISPSENHC